MATEPHPLLASSPSGIGLLAVGVLLIAVLLAAFLVGHRNSARRRKSASVPSREQEKQARQVLEDPPRRGEGWSTPEEDPDQGHPHR